MFENSFYIRYIEMTNTYLLLLQDYHYCLCTSSSLEHILNDRIPHFVEMFKSEELMLEQLRKLDDWKRVTDKYSSWYASYNTYFNTNEWLEFDEQVKKAVKRGLNKQAIEIGRAFRKPRPKGLKKVIELEEVKQLVVTKEEPVEVKPKLKKRFSRVLFKK